MSDHLPDTPAAQWMSAYLDGTIGEADFARLAQYLRASEAHRDELAAAVQMEEMMRVAVSHADRVCLLSDEGVAPAEDRGAGSATALLALLAASEPAEGEVELVDLTQTLRERDANRRLRLAAQQQRMRPPGPREPTRRVIVIPMPLVYLAAAAAVALVVTAFLAVRSGPSANHTDQAQGRDVAPARPPVLATVTDTFMAAWGGGSEPGFDGRTLVPGRYELLDGQARMTLADGTRLKLVAPVRFELDRVGEVRLVSGQLVADVPPAAIGFRVDTPAGVVVDLGTTFGVEVMDKDTVEAEVVSGLIRVASRTASGELTEFVDVEEARAARMDRRAGAVEAIQAGGTASAWITCG